MPDEETRSLSSAVFGNDKWVDVALALDRFQGVMISQEIATRIGVNSDLVTKVLQRMQRADLVKALPRVGRSSRGAVPWEVQRGSRWDAVVALCRVIDER